MQFKIKDFHSIHRNTAYLILMERFANLCNSYTKSYNKVYERKGALFIDYLKRQKLTMINISAILSTTFILMPSIMASAKILLIGNGHLFMLFLLIKGQGSKQPTY
jgi:hypothetical protein